MKVILISAGGHARVLKEILSLSGQFDIVGFTDLEPKVIVGLKYLGDDTAIQRYSADEILLVNGIGSVGLPVRRQEVFEELKGKGYRFASVIHPQSVISADTNIGEGVQIMAGVVINLGTIIGENVIINTSASIDHDCQIDAHSHIAPGVVISGGANIGRSCHIGTGAVIVQGITIGDNVVVGTGSVVIEDIPSGVTTFGVPAKIKR